MVTIADNVKKLRIEKNLTQKELGKRCELAESTIRQYELGKRNPKLETILKIANGLGVEPEELTKDVPVPGMCFKPLSLQTRLENVCSHKSENDYEKEYGMKELTLEESKLLEDIKQLNINGKMKVLEYVDMLLQIKEFCNNKIDELESEANQFDKLVNELESGEHKDLNPEHRQVALNEAKELAKMQRDKADVLKRVKNSVESGKLLRKEEGEKLLDVSLDED